LVNLILFIIPLSLIFSLPSYAIEQNSNCINCHVNPTGGLMRNDYGSNIYSLDELSIRKWITEDKKFDGFISDNIQIGGEFRIQSYKGRKSTSIFPMQIDLYSNVDFDNNISLFLKYGAKQELYLLLDDYNNVDWIKIGKTIPDYGLKLDDHTSFIRGGNSSNTFVYSGSIDQGLIFDYAAEYDDPILIEMGLKINKNISLTSSISNGIVNDNENNITISIKSKSSSIYGNLLFGSSLMKEKDFKMLGIFGGFAKNKLTLSFEFDKAYNWIENFKSMASYMELIYKPVQGVHLTAKYDYFDKDISVLDGSTERYSFGVNFFPINMLELKFQIREYELFSIDTNINTEYLVQLHTWF
tara:strand:+ start:831 stop:1898 length:1068 start_codon:yes stop_codon:yes gene_type:complete